MSLQIVGQTFDGPFTSTAPLRDRSGVYVILTRRNQYESYTMVDVGESAAVRTRVANHDRSTCWSQHNLGELSVAVLYTPNMASSGRTSIERVIRHRFSPACGVR